MCALCTSSPNKLLPHWCPTPSPAAAEGCCCRCRLLFARQSVQTFNVFVVRHTSERLGAHVWWCGVYIILAAYISILISWGTTPFPNPLAILWKLCKNIIVCIVGFSLKGSTRSSVVVIGRIGWSARKNVFFLLKEMYSSIISVKILFNFAQSADIMIDSISCLGSQNSANL